MKRIWIGLLAAILCLAFSGCDHSKQEASMSPDTDTVMEVIRAHGTHRILFATDCPWGDPAAFVRYVRALPLTESEREDIFHRNAQRLLFGDEKKFTL